MASVTASSNRRSSRRPAGAALVLTLALAIVAGGCGGGSSDSNGSTAEAPPNPYARGGSAESQAPKGASPVLREIYRQFPAPKADPAVRRSARSIAAGKKACAGKSPLEVKEEFYPEAIESGGLEEGSPQADMIAEIKSYEKSSPDPSFAAGQLAAGAYEATLPEAIARFGYQGCIYALSLRLKRELAPGHAG